MDENEAPKGFKAKELEVFSCQGCAFASQYGCALIDHLTVSCVDKDRKDGTNVVFVEATDA